MSKIDDTIREIRVHTVAGKLLGFVGICLDEMKNGGSPDDMAEKAMQLARTIVQEIVPEKTSKEQ